jgi:hypothetical protein
MFGLSFAVLLCLIVTPVFYAIFFGIHEPSSAGPQQSLDSSTSAPRPA